MPNGLQLLADALNGRYRRAQKNAESFIPHDQIKPLVKDVADVQFCLERLFESEREVIKLRVGIGCKMHVWQDIARILSDKGLFRFTEAQGNAGARLAESTFNDAMTKLYNLMKGKDYDIRSAE